MGLHIGFSDSCCDEIVERDKDTTPNPNPYNFTIEKFKQLGIFLILNVRYHNCITYDGLKILVYINKKIEDFFKVEKIDPHFYPDKFSPIARFPGSEKGFEMAEIFCKAMINGVFVKCDKCNGTGRIVVYQESGSFECNKCKGWGKICGSQTPNKEQR